MPERISIAEWKAQPKIGRCKECGRQVHRSDHYERTACPSHPTSELIPWRIGVGLAVAEYYLVHEAVGRLGLSGPELDHWVKTYDVNLFPCGRGGREMMAHMLFYLRRWGWPAFSGEDLFSRPIVMYGREVPS